MGVPRLLLPQVSTEVDAHLSYDTKVGGRGAGGAGVQSDLVCLCVAACLGWGGAGQLSGPGCPLRLLCASHHLDN